MTVLQGDLHLLEDPVAQDLLGSKELARLAYTWLAGTPRVVPIWFHWTAHVRKPTKGPEDPRPAARAAGGRHDRRGRRLALPRADGSW